MSVERSAMVAGNVLQFGVGSRYAYKLTEKHWFGATSYWIYQTGQIKDNKFVGDSETDSYQMMSAESLRTAVGNVWKPGPQFDEGDVLVAADGTVIIVGRTIENFGGEKTQQFWYAQQGRGWDRQADVVATHGKLSFLKSNTGKKFTGAKLV